MKRILSLLLALTATASLSAQVYLTNFGSVEFLETEGLTQTTSSGTFEGAASEVIIWGDFASLIDITGFTSALSFTATVFDNPGTGFQIDLYDDVDNVYSYEGLWSDFTTGIQSTIRLTAMPGQEDPFDFTQVVGLDFSSDGSPSQQLNATFSGLTAVPEPSTYAALVGLISLGGALLRRRRA